MSLGGRHSAYYTIPHCQPKHPSPVPHFAKFSGHFLSAKPVPLGYRRSASSGGPGTGESSSTNVQGSVRLGLWFCNSPPAAESSLSVRTGTHASSGAQRGSAHKGTRYKELRLKAPFQQGPVPAQGTMPSGSPVASPSPCPSPPDTTTSDGTYYLVPGLLWQSWLHTHTHPTGRRQEPGGRDRIPALCSSLEEA